MTDAKHRTGDLKDTVVRICPACGVVNPAGPSDACPHLQLAKFEGMDDDLGELLADVAEARAQYATLVGDLKDRVKAAVRNREAEIEMPRKMRPSELDDLSRPRDGSTLVLKNPDPPQPPSTPDTNRIRKRRRKGPPKVDPRQLDLIAREPPKGDA